MGLGSPAQVFIGYRRADRPAVSTLAHAIENLGYSVFWDEDLVAGDAWHESLDRRILSAKATIIVWSQEVLNTPESPVWREATIANKRGNLLNVIIDDVGIPFPFSRIHCEDLCPRVGGDRYWPRSKGNDAWDAHPGFQKLSDALKRKVGATEVEIRKRKKSAVWVALATIVIALIGVLGWGAIRFEAFRQTQTPPITLYAQGEAFRDCDEPSQCPEMVVVPSGSFVMGQARDESLRESDEAPAHSVQLAAFAVSRFEISRGEFSRFVGATNYVQAGGCWTDVDHNGGFTQNANGGFTNVGFVQGSETEPAVCISWDDAVAYVAWLSRMTSRQYRLLSESEWEYVARAGATSGDYPATARALCRVANGSDTAGSAAITRVQDRVRDPVPCDDGDRWTAERTDYDPNAFGLVHLIGNAQEWVQDCYANTYDRAPTDGGAFQLVDCERHVLRGGSWYNGMRDLRYAARTFYRPPNGPARRSDTGFRIATSDLIVR